MGLGGGRVDPKKKNVGREGEEGQNLKLGCLSSLTGMN